MSNLNPKQKRFCEEYVIDHNGTQAAIRAGYSKKAAAPTASEFLTNPKIQLYISDLQEQIRIRANVSADMVVEELKSLGFWSIKDFVGLANTVNDLSKMDRKTLRPVTGIKTTTKWEMIGKMLQPVTTTELKFADKRSALEALGRHLGIFKDDNEQKALKIKVTRK